MKQPKHYAVLAPDLTNHSSLLKDLLKGKAPALFPELAGLSGAFFSPLTIEKFIHEEVKHEKYDLTGEQHRSLRTLSSGEKKEILLHYIIAHKPDFLAIEHPFDSLDVNAKQRLSTTLQNIQHTIPIIQIFSRQKELLPFIAEIIHLKEEKILFRGTPKNYLNKINSQKNVPVSLPLPKPLHPYTTNNPLVKFNQTSIKYEDRPILKDISWEIKNGEFWQLVGPNGSGKTTLLTMITGDNPKAFGQDLTIFGRRKGSGESVWEIKEKIGYFTPSMMDLFSGNYTVEQMVISGLADSIGLYQQPSDIQKRLAGEWIDIISLAQQSKTPFLHLPKYQQRMVLIARAMIKHPPLLILDEPSTGLDDRSTSLLIDLIHKIAAESNTAIIYVSHQQEASLRPQYTYELQPSNTGSTGYLTKERSQKAGQQ